MNLAIRLPPRILLGIVVPLVLLFAAWPAGADPQGVPVVLERVDGPEVRGRLAALDAAAATVDRERVPLETVVALRFLAPTTAPAPPDGAPDAAPLRVHLTDGSVLRGRYAGKSEEGLLLDVASGGEILLGYEAIRTLVNVSPSAGPCREAAVSGRPEPGRDVLVLEGGDTYEGLLLAIDPEGFTIETEGGQERRLGWDAVRVLHLDNPEAPSPEGLRVEVETRDGSRWAAAAPPVLVEGALRLALRAQPGRAIALPLGALAALRPSGGAFEYACHLPFESRLASPYGEGTGEDEDRMEATFLDTWFGTRVDRRPSGCPLRLAGETYRHGFAVHSKSVVTIPLAGQWRAFRAVFGVDDEALEVPVGGIVDARVLVDGEVVWSAKGVRAGEAPRRIGPLDVAGASTLVLEVDEGEAMHVRDRATWADPLLVK